MGLYIFERKIDQAYENCRGVVRKADNVEVFGKEKTTYDRICMQKWNALEKKALSIILANALLRPNAVVIEPIQSRRGQSWPEEGRSQQTNVDSHK